MAPLFWPWLRDQKSIHPLSTVCENSAGIAGEQLKIRVEAEQSFNLVPQNPTSYNCDVLAFTQKAHPLDSPQTMDQKNNSCITNKCWPATIQHSLKKRYLLSFVIATNAMVSETWAPRFWYLQSTVQSWLWSATTLPPYKNWLRTNIHISFMLKKSEWEQNEMII